LPVFDIHAALLWVKVCSKGRTPSQNLGTPKGTKMDRVKTLFSSTIFLLLLFILNVHPSFAALGEVEDSVTSDQTKILGPKASFSMTAHGNYRMHEMKKTNQTVHEFVTSDGRVFAVTWKGPVHPDFSVLFGNYFKDYQDARQAAHDQRLRRRSGTIESGDLHVEIGGHMAAQSGRAWVKSILPAGFDINDIH
jgi:hypothetical protein